MRCQIDNPGGVEPYTIKWYLNGNYREFTMGRVRSISTARASTGYELRFGIPRAIMVI
jgi:hypothetical protein